MNLKDLHIGDRVADRGNPHIILRVAGRDLPGYPGTVMVADSIIKQGCFDAKEPTNPDSARRSYGNNHYGTSNAHQWLNATGPDWYKPAHEYDAAPLAGGIYDGDNPYAEDNGFLTGFSDAFMAALAEADIQTRDITDDSIQTVKAKVWLMSATEVGQDERGHTEGHRFPLFDDFRMKVAAPTKEAVDDADWTPDSFNPTEGWPYWLRSPNFSYSYYVRLVNADGGETSNNAYNGIYGLRPALLLKSEISVSDSPDERGVYITG